jgi:hypothetical protein
LSEPVNGPRAIIIMACDLSSQGALIGWETKARCEKGIEEYEKFSDSRIVLMAGRADPKKYPRQNRSLALMMKDYLVNRGIPAQVITASENPRVWGSKDEIEMALRWIFLQDDYYGVRNNQGRRVEVTIVSSDYHIRRLKFIIDRAVKSLNIVGLTWIFSYETVGGDLRNRRIEWIKYPLYVIRELIFNR